MSFPPCTYQSVSNENEGVKGFNAVGAVLPLAVHYQTWLLLHPWEVVVLVAIVDGVGSSGCGGLG